MKAAKQNKPGEIASFLEVGMASSHAPESLPCKDLKRAASFVEECSIIS